MSATVTGPSTPESRSELSAAAKRRLRLIVETYYDAQDVRMRTENRILHYAEEVGLAAVLGDVAVTELRRQGQDKYKAAIRVLKFGPEAQAELKKVGVETFKAAYPNTDNIDAKLSFWLAAKEAVDQLESDERHNKVNDLMRKQEPLLKNQAMREIEGQPIWESWLQYVTGIGPCLAGGLISWADLTRCKHAGGLWKYFGMAVIVDEYFCRTCNKQYSDEEVPEVEERMAKGMAHEAARCPGCNDFLQIKGHADRRVKGEVTGYNPRAKTLAFKIGTSFIRSNPERSGYRRIYEKIRAVVDKKVADHGGYCNKVHTDKKTKKVIPCFDAHKLAMARRATVKVFLGHYYLVGRRLLGLPVSDPYSLGMMGIPVSEFSDPIYDDRPEHGKV